MPQVCVHDAQVLISSTSGYVMTVSQSTVAAQSNTLISVNGSKALILNDVEQWVTSYSSAYTTASYSIPGMARGTNLILPPSPGVSLLTQSDNNPVLLDSTKFSFMMAVTQQAKNSSGIPDSVPTFILTLEFTFSNQMNLLLTN